MNHACYLEFSKKNNKIPRIFDLCSNMNQACGFEFYQNKDFSKPYLFNLFLFKR